MGKLLKYLGDIPLINIDEGAVQNYIYGELKTRKASGVGVDYTILVTAFRFAMRKKLIVENPMEGVIRPKSPRRLPRKFQLHEVRKIFSVIDRKDDRIIMLILLLTGLRINELLSLTWDEIDFKSQIMRITGKGGHERNLFLSGLLSDLLSKIERKGSLMFPDLNYQILGYRFRRYFDLAGIPPRSGMFHRFRHTFGSLLGDMGSSAFVLKQLLGHSSTAMSEIYTNLSNRSLRTSMNQLGEVLKSEIDLDTFLDTN